MLNPKWRQGFHCSWPPLPEPLFPEAIKELDPIPQISPRWNVSIIPFVFSPEFSVQAIIPEHTE